MATNLTITVKIGTTTVATQTIDIADKGLCKNWTHVKTLMRKFMNSTIRDFMENYQSSSTAFWVNLRSQIGGS